MKQWYALYVYSNSYEKFVAIHTIGKSNEFIDDWKVTFVMHMQR